MGPRKGIKNVLLGLMVVLLCGSTHAAFLGASLPLEPLLTTPSELLSNGTKTVKLSDRTPIQVVFSRPVIALGSDFGAAALPKSQVPFTLGCPIPGLSRWVTTTIFRFDPAVDYPTDLECSFKWNTALVSYDGAKLVLPASAPTDIKLVSDPLTFEVAGVASARAENVTDNQWSAYRGMKDDNFPEVPPDANVTLSFSYPVVLSSLASALKVTSCCKRDDGKGRTVRVLPCYTPWRTQPLLGAAAGGAGAAAAANTTCAVIQIVPGLKAGQVVSLQLPKGAAYNPIAGKARNATEVYLWGLRKFRIPLRDNFQQLTSASEAFNDDDNGVAYRRATLWLPHGLAPGVRAADVAAQMSLCRYEDPYKWASPCKPVDFFLESINKGKLLMRVPTFAPRQHFKLTVKGSSKVKDAFGLPLEPSEAFFFTSDPSPGLSGPQLSTGAPLMVFEPSPDGAGLSWPIASRGQPRWDSDPTGVEVWPITPASYPAALVAANSFDDKLPTKLGMPNSQVKRNTGSIPKIESLSLGSGPGIQFVAQTLKGTKRIGSPTYVAQTALQFASITVDRRLYVWVTDTRGSPPPPVKGAKVSLYLTSYSGGASQESGCVTAADGTCVIDMRGMLKGRSGSLSALVEASGYGALVVNQIDTPYVSADDKPKDWAGALVLDRALAQPGDKLHVTGFVQRRDGAKLLLPGGGFKPANLSISPNWNASDSNPVKIPVTIDPKFGSIHANVTVPPAAQLAQYEMQLEVDGQAAVASENFQVADPRPPTAVLNVTAPDWAMPNSTVKALLKVTSYLGADVADATIKVTWTVPRASGVINVTTDARGRAVVRIPLGELPKANATRLGDNLEVRANWVGPTGEPYMEKRVVRMAEGPVRAELLRSPVTDAPGVPFIVAPQTFALSNGDDLPIEGVKVEVYLAPANETALANCSAAQRAAVASQRCTAVSGSPAPDCQITLPCAADLLLRACAVSFANGTRVPSGAPGGRAPCSETPIGRNTTAWAASPWSQQPSLGLLPDRANYSLGDTALLSFSIPAYMGDAAALLVWGNGDAQKSRTLTRVAAGPGRVSIGPLGDECRGGCKAALIFAVGRRAGKAAADAAGKLPRVPTSKLFDPLGPLTLSATATLNVVGEAALNVTVGVAGAEGLKTRDGGLAVAAPLGRAAVTVKAIDAATGAPAAGAEVTVVIVDRSNLDLAPYDLKDLPADISKRPDLYMAIRELNANRATRAAVNETFATLMRRLGAEPWLPLATTVTPSAGYSANAWGAAPYYGAASPVDESDAKYFARFSTPLTVTPFYTWGITQRYPAASRGAPSGDKAAALRTSDQFQVTPVFATVIADASGTAKLEFDAPANLGAFSVRAYVVSKGVADKASKYGANETEVVVRLPVSLTPALPRIVRVGDTFESGVIVSAPDAGAEPLTVTVTATVMPPNAAADAAGPAAKNGTSAKAGRSLLAESGEQASIVLLPSDPYSREASLSAARQQREVRFRFSAARIGASGLRFDVYLGNGAGRRPAASDSASFDVPVLGRQSPVFIGTSFALAAGGGDAAAVEGLELPQAEPGSGTIDLVAGVGNLPFLQTTYASLVEAQQRAEDPPSSPLATDLLATAVLPAFMSRYAPEGPAAPLVTKNQLEASRAAAKKLLDVLNDPQYGLQWTDWRDRPNGGAPSATDVSLNGWALWLLEEAAAAVAPAGGAKAATGLAAEVAGYLKPLQAAAPAWRAAIGRQVTKDAVSARASAPWVDKFATPPKKYPTAEPFSDWDAMSWARLALGAQWSPEVDAKTAKDAGVSVSAVTWDLALPRLAAAAAAPGNASVGTAARTGLALLAAAPKDASALKAAAKIAASLASLVRIQGRTAYLSTTPGAAFAASPEDQAFALAFLERANAAKAAPEAAAAVVLQKLSAGLARGRAAGLPQLSTGTSSSASAVASATLASYDASRGSTSPDASVTVSALSKDEPRAASDDVLLRADFTPKSAARAANSSTAWGALPAGASRLAFDAKGRGEVSVAAGLTFTPATLLPFPTYRGLFVERVVSDESGSGSLAAAAAGRVVTVTVQITSPDDLGEVTVEVPMPGGLEPIDPAVYKDPSAAATCGLGTGRFWWWCPRVTVTPSLVTIRYARLGAGTAVVGFKATAATPGEFVLPPVKAFAVGQPEVMGLSAAAASFAVCPARRPPASTPLVKDPGFGAEDPAEDEAVAAAAAAAAGQASRDASVFGPLPAACASEAAAARPPVAPAKACPNDCSGNGACNLASGACVCNIGFVGADCGKLAATR